MNLMKYFNFNYLKENIKKSRVFLSFMLVLFPLLNMIILYLNSNNLNIVKFNDLSALTLCLMYILPISLSFALFGYVFKKKSIDFIGSMPLSRKTIFLTNTLGGILILTLMFLITSILMYFVGLFSPNIVIYYKIIIDYFILFLSSYIFLFTISNIAISVSGNSTSSIVVILLITFLLPILSYYFIDSAHIINYNIKFNGTNPFNVIVNSISNLKYTLPAGFLFSIFSFEDISLYNLTNITATIILSIIYIFVGLYLFNKKEYEISETSFKTNKIHVIIKTLTYIPIMLFATNIFREGYIPLILFVLVILYIYNVIYDLIVKRKVDKILRNSIIFVITIISLFLINSGILNMTKINKNIEFSSNDIESIRLNDYNNKKLDKNMYNLLFSGVSRNYENNEYKSRYVYIDFTIKLKNNKNIKLTSALNSKDYEKIVYSDSGLSLDNFVAASVFNNEILLSEDEFKLIDKNIKSAKGLNGFMYIYDNHELIINEFNTGNSKLTRIIIDKLNKKFFDYIKNNDITKNDGHININDILGSDDNISVYLDEGTNDYIKSIKSKTINYDEPVYILEYYTNDGYFYYFTNLTKKELDLFKDYNDYKY